MTVAILEADVKNQQLVYNDFQVINPGQSLTGKKFDPDGFFVFTQNKTQDYPDSSQVFYSLVSEV